MPEPLGTGLHVPGDTDVSQMPEQHWVAAAQAPPSTVQAFAEQVPPTHDSEQHSEEFEHSCPAPWQNAAVVHVPVVWPDATSQIAEQHSSRLVQAASTALHVVTAGAAQT